MAKPKKTILILTGDAGLGHRSAAEAIQAAVETRYGDRCKTIIKNPLNHPDIPDVIRNSQSDYDEIVKAIPELYKLGFKVSDSTLPVKLMEGGFTVLLLGVLRQTLNETQPDLIITTYPIYQAPLHALFEVDDRDIPLIAVVTDLVTVHHVWFNPNTTLCTVPTDTVREMAENAGLAPDQVVKTGIPVDPQIVTLKDTDQVELRRELGWKTDKTTLLVVGSPRVPVLMDIVKLLDHSGFVFQFALVAGGNEELYQKFQDTDWHHPAQVYDFVENMPEMMRASDLIVSKAGGLIVTETLASGRPLMLVHVLPGQERGNVSYVVENGAGARCETPQEALNTLSHWLHNDGALLKEVSKNAARLGRADAAFIIAKKALSLID